MNFKAKVLLILPLCILKNLRKSFSAIYRQNYNLLLQPSIENDGKIAYIIMEFINLWMKLQSANSKDCQRLLMCDLNHVISGQDSDHWNLSQICSLAVSKYATRVKAL